MESSKDPDRSSTAAEAEACFRRDLASLLNRYSKENGSNTPDFLLADYLTGCLNVWDRTARARERWYGTSHTPGGTGAGDGAVTA